MARYRTYVDGKLAKSSVLKDVEQGMRWLDAREADWMRGGLCPLVGPGEFDPNNAHEVKREGAGVLTVVTTGGRKLRFVVVE